MNIEHINYFVSQLETLSLSLYWSLKFLLKNAQYKKYCRKLLIIFKHIYASLQYGHKIKN